MKRAGIVAVVVASGFVGGCSNAPLAGTLDCIFPSRVNIRPNADLPRPGDLFRPRDRDRDTLPPPDLREPRFPSDSGRLEGLPKIGEPFESDNVPRGRDANTTGDRMPLPTPVFPRDPEPPLRERN